MKNDRLAQTFLEEIQDTDEAAFYQAAHSFLNLWDYEYGHVSDMPNDMHQYIDSLLTTAGLEE